MEEMLKKLLIEILIVVLPVLTTFFIQYLNAKTKELKEQTENKQLNNYIDVAEDLIEKTVVAANQRIVDDLKKSNNFNEQAKTQVFNDVKDIVMQNLTEQSKKAIQLLYTDLNNYIDLQIQNSVNKNKINKKEVTK